MNVCHQGLPGEVPSRVNERERVMLSNQTPAQEVCWVSVSSTLEQFLLETDRNSL